MTEERIELWSNSTLSEFAIKFKSNCVVETNHGSKYIRKLDESPYKQGYNHHNWSYTLSQ